MDRIRRIVAVVTLTLFACTISIAADWTRWLGPEHTGASSERDVFGADAKLDVAWTKPLGIAYSAIAVADGKAVTMYGDGKTDWLVALDATSGEQAWRYRVGKMFPKIGGAHGGQLSMPVIDDGRVYGLGAKGQLFAVKLEDGSKVWSMRIDKKLGAKQPHFGFTTTPLVAGDLLIVQTGGADGRSLTALDKKTGKIKWSRGDEAVGYQSPVLLELAGREQIVAVTNTSVAGLSPADGNLLWRTEHALSDRDGWSTPIALDAGAFVLTAQNESAAYRVRDAGGSFSVEQLWRGSSLKKNFAMPVVYDDHIYGYDADFLACVDARTGARVWKERSEAAGLILVDGHLVIFASDGSLVVAEASPEGFEIATRAKVSEEGGFTFPSFSDGGIFVRNMESIARVDVR
jgi:outer membrane protein assembly factor BamB